jgi:hypothetical protein
MVGFEGKEGAGVLMEQLLKLNIHAIQQLIFCIYACRDLIIIQCWSMGDTL